MAGRKIVYLPGHYYHVYNRGIARQPVFFGKRDYDRFILTLSYYQYENPPVKLSRLLQLPLDERQFVWDKMKKGKKLISIISYVCMPNHIHLLLRQEEEKGITLFMSKSFNSYTKYINTRHERVGDLFQGVFKGKYVETDEQLIHLSRYIHLNPVASGVIRESSLESYPWSSFPEYLKRESFTVDTQPVLTNFRSPTDYKKFVVDHIGYAKKLEEIKHLVLE